MSKKFHINDLANSTFSDRIVAAFAKIEIKVEDSDQSHSRNRTIAVAAKSDIDLKIRPPVVPNKKIVIAVGSSLSLLGIATKIIIDNWPTIQAFFK